MRLDRPTFGRALSAARVAATYSQDDIGALLEVTGQAVSAWEVGTAAPVREHYEELLRMFPELKTAPEPEWRDIAPPDGGKGIPRGARSWSDRLRDAITRHANGHAGALSALLCNLASEDHARAELRALQAQITKILRAWPEERRARTATPLESMSLAERYHHATVQRETAFLHIQRFERALAKARESLARWSGEADLLLSQMNEQARKQATAELPEFDAEQEYAA